jgi:holo-[acyl-carrier protein] synthase
MIGIDITNINRFKKNMDRLADKILTVEELSEYNQSKNKSNYLAGRWACKEAVFKATGLDDVCVLSKTDGKPFIKDHHDIEISISHDREFAIAVAILNKQREPL